MQRSSRAVGGVPASDFEATLTIPFDLASMTAAVVTIPVVGKISDAGIVDRER
jgi:hypothetical protein